MLIDATNVGRGHILSNVLPNNGWSYWYRITQSGVFFGRLIQFRASFLSFPKIELFMATVVDADI